MKKTLLITLDFPPQIGGVSNYLLNFCKSIPPDRLVVFAPNNGQAPTFDTSQRFKIIRGDLLSEISWVYPKWIFLMFKLWKIVKNENIEMVMVGQVLPLGTATYYLTKFLDINYLVLTYGMDVSLPLKFSRKKILLKKIFKKARSIITISNFTKKIIKSLGVKDEQIKIIPPCVETREVTEDEALKNEIIKKYTLANKRIILSVGRLVERKGHDYVIKAMTQVLDTIPEALYLIVGDGPEKDSLKKLTAELNLENNIKFLEEISNSELNQVYFLTDLLILNSREIESEGDFEGFGIVFLEAGLYKLPVIGGNSGGIPDAVLEGETGFLVNPLDPEDISEKIIKILTNPDLSIKLGNQGKKRVLNEFDCKDQTNKILNLLN